MVEPLIWLGASWAVATVGGIVAGLLEYLADPKKRLDRRKLKKPIILGVISGLIFGIVNGSVNPAFKDPNSNLFDVAYQLGLVFAGVLGVDAVSYHRDIISERKIAANDCIRKVGEARTKGEFDGTLFGMERLTIAADRNALYPGTSADTRFYDKEFYNKVSVWIRGEIRSIEDERKKLKEIRERP